MQLDNFSVDGVEMLKDDKTPYGCLRIYWSSVDEDGESRRGSVDLTITQDKELSFITSEPFILVENEFDSQAVNKDFIQQLLISLADKII